MVAKKWPCRTSALDSNTGDDSLQERTSSNVIDNNILAIFDIFCVLFSLLLALGVLFIFIGDRYSNEMRWQFWRDDRHSSGTLAVVLSSVACRRSLPPASGTPAGRPIGWRCRSASPRGANVAPLASAAHRTTVRRRPAPASLTSSALSDANTQWHPLRRGSVSKIARTGDANQIVRGPVLESGSTARSPWTCSHRRPSASDLRAPV